MVRPSRVLLVASVLMLCAALVGGPRAAASGAAPPWESAGPFPASYDLRDHGKVTGVREQAHKSTCWIIGATGSLESCLLPGALHDFSENNLANHQGSLLDFGGRADSKLSTAYFARWDGPVLERQDPYPYPGASPEGLRPALHVQDVLFLPPLAGSRDSAALKWAITTYGGVDVTMRWTIRDPGVVGACPTRAPVPPQRAKGVAGAIDVSHEGSARTSSPCPATSTRTCASRRLWMRPARSTPSRRGSPCPRTASAEERLRVCDGGSPTPRSPAPVRWSSSASVTAMACCLRDAASRPSWSGNAGRGRSVAGGAPVRTTCARERATSPATNRPTRAARR